MVYNKMSNPYGINQILQPVYINQVGFAASNNINDLMVLLILILLLLFLDEYNLL